MHLLDIAIAFSIALVIFAWVVDNFIMFTSEYHTCPHCHARKSYRHGFIVWQCSNTKHTEIAKREERG